MRSPRVRVALIDYGAGNLRSIGRALTLAGAEVGVVTQAPTGERVDGIVLPGVGAFGAAMARLQAAGFRTGSARRSQTAFRCWACAWECSCCLRAARNPRPP